MKKIGILGGVAWVSTVDYYAGLCRRTEARHAASGREGPVQYPEIAIESLNLSKALSLWGDDADEASWREFDEYHRQALLRLEASGADFALMASNSPHHRFDAIVRGLKIPVLSIVEEAARECQRIGIGRILLFGTALTMRSEAFRRGFAKFGVEAFAPADPAVRSSVEALIVRLQAGRTAGATEELRDLTLRSYPPGAGAQPATCLSCTELPLAFADPALPASFIQGGIRYINANAAHIDTAFARAE